MAHTMKPGTVAVELPGHGEFATSVEFVTKLDAMSKHDLARNIADAYGGGCGKASTRAYWLTYPRTLLAIVYGGLVEPRN
jgi:hypothetical protein